MRQRIRVLFMVTMLSLSVFLTVLPFITKTNISTYASFGLCSDLGSNMTTKENVNYDVIAPDAKNRKWTIQELFAHGMKNTTYNGEGDKTWLLSDTKGRGEKYAFMGDADVKAKVEGIRSVNRCLTGGLATVPSDLAFMGASLIASFVSLIVSSLFSGSIVCDVDGQGSACIDLIGIVGGENQGIIASLRDNIFEPLAVLAFIFVGVWLIYNGLIKRQLRSSFMGVLWSLLLFFGGTIALANPALLASAPQQVNSTISTCLLGAMNGQNCMTGEVTMPASMVGEECTSKADTKGNEGAALAANAMSCSIWKSFVLNPWVNSQFGKNYNELYLKNPEKGGSVLANVPEDVSDLGVSMKSTSSANEARDGVLITSGGEIYNLALYQLYLSTNMTSADKKVGDPVYDARWNNVVGIAAKNPSIWSTWSAQGGTKSFIRLAYGLQSIAIIVVVGVSLAIFAFWGLIYLFTGTLLMAFAPLFLLVGIHPGRGKQIFIGWLDSVVSSVLKYMASSLFVIVALSLYTAVLSSVKNPVSQLIGVIIMAATLMIYRKEFVNIMGMANLGGQKFSNAVGDKLSGLGGTAKSAATTVGAGALGGVMATRSLDKKDRTVKSYIKNAFSGAAGSVSRQAKRGDNFTGALSRQYGATKHSLNAKAAREEAERKEKEKKREELANKSTEKETDKKNEASENEATKDKNHNESTPASEETPTNDVVDRVGKGVNHGANNEGAGHLSDQREAPNSDSPENDPTLKVKESEEIPSEAKSETEEQQPKSEERRYSRYPEEKPTPSPQGNEESSKSTRKEPEVDDSVSVKSTQGRGQRSPAHTEAPSPDRYRERPPLEAKLPIRETKTGPLPEIKSTAGETKTGPLPEIKSTHEREERKGEDKKEERQSEEPKASKGPTLPSLNKLTKEREVEREDDRDE